MHSSKFFVSGLSALLVTAGAVNAAFVITNPWGSNPMPNVNGNNEAIFSAVGNISLTNYNAISTKRVFNFDHVTYSGNNGTTQSVGGTLTATGDGVTATFGGSNGTFSFITAGANFSTSTTGVEQAINTNRTSNSVSFSTGGVDAFAFTIPRLQVNASLTLNFVGGGTSVYVIPLNSVAAVGGANPVPEIARNGYFGYSRLNESTATAKVSSFSIVTSGTQYGIDDFSFVSSIPEPASLGLFGLAATAMLRRRAVRA